LRRRRKRRATGKRSVRRLAPPRPGEEDRNRLMPQDEARELLLGTKAKPATLDDAMRDVNGNVDTAVEPILTTEAPTGADSSFLKKLGVDSANPDIRSQLAADVKTEPKKKKKAQSLYERVVGADKPEPVVDAKGEAERIRTNRDAGKPVTEGDTPTVDEKKKSVIDAIF